MTLNSPSFAKRLVLRGVLAVALTLGLITPAALPGAVQVSYLGIQHGANNHAWAFHYDSTDPLAPQTGYDLFETLFGTPVPAGTYLDGFGGSYNYLVMGDADNGLGLIDFGFGLFIESITLDGVTIAMPTNYSQIWGYSVAGGLNGAVDGGMLPIPPPDGVWTSAQLGFSDRLISDGSFDGWSFGTGAPGFAPLADDPVFANATVVLVGSLIPEPGRAVLLGIALFGMVIRRRR